KKVSKGLLTAALGFSLIGGGTYAYFSDEVEANNTFATGTLDLSVNPEAIVNIDNLKPGDEISREFTVTNDGTLDIKEYYWRRAMTLLMLKLIIRMTLVSILR